MLHWQSVSPSCYLQQILTHNLLAGSYINFRLWLHYLWLIICLAGIACIYLYVPFSMLIKDNQRTLTC